MLEIKRQAPVPAGQSVSVLDQPIVYNRPVKKPIVYHDGVDLKVLDYARSLVKQGKTEEAHIISVSDMMFQAEKEGLMEPRILAFNHLYRAVYEIFKPGEVSGSDAILRSFLSS